MFNNIEKLYAQLHHIYIRHPSNLLKFMISYFFFQNLKILRTKITSNRIVINW